MGMGGRDVGGLSLKWIDAVSPLLPFPGRIRSNAGGSSVSRRKSGKLRPGKMWESPSLTFPGYSEEHQQKLSFCFPRFPVPT